MLTHHDRQYRDDNRGGYQQTPQYDNYCRTDYELLPREQQKNGLSICEYPRWPSYDPWSLSRRFVKGLVLLFFSIALASQVGHLFFTIKFIATDSNEYPTDHESYKLYKNTGFGECISKIPDPANCTAIKDLIRHSKYPLDREYINNGYTPINRQRYTTGGVSYDWCTFVSCFHNYTIIPSTPQDAAIGLTTMELWGSINMTAVLALFCFLKRYWKPQTKETCKGPGVLDYVPLLYVLASDVWWWIDYIQFAIDPVPNTTVSIFQWVAIWLVAMQLQYHPFSCVLGEWKRYALYVLALLAIVQWGATVHVMAVGWPHTLHQGSIIQSYECVETMMSDLPTSSNCSVQALCSDAKLLSDPSFRWNFFGDQGVLEYVIAPGAIAYITVSTLFAVQPFICSFYGTGNFKQRFRRFDYGPIMGPMMVAISMTLLCGLTCTALVKLNSHMLREGPAIAYEACSVIHVGLSPWRYYLDLKEFNRVYRIAKVWFNA